MIFADYMVMKLLHKHHHDCIILYDLKLLFSHNEIYFELNYVIGKSNVTHILKHLILRSEEIILNLILLYI